MARTRPRGSGLSRNQQRVLEGLLDDAMASMELAREATGNKAARATTMQAMKSVQGARDAVGVPDERWPTARAAAELGCTAATVRRHIIIGLLNGRKRSGRRTVSSTDVLRLAKLRDDATSAEQELRPRRR
jgi:hypothetical protein